MHRQLFLSNSNCSLALADFKTLNASGRTQILRSPRMATRMHRLFKASLQRLMRGRRLKAPRLHRNGEWGDNNHDHHSGCNPALSSARGVADLALQPWLGILSQQRSGSGCVGPRNSFAPRAHITPGLFSLVESKVVRGSEPRLCVHAVSFFDRPCVNGHLAERKGKTVHQTELTMLEINSRTGPLTDVRMADST
jgi:hypothetical protein